MRRLFALAAWLLVAPLAAAQPADLPAADEVRAAVARLFDGMRARDTSAVRALMHPTARLQSVARQGDGYVVQGGPVDGFVAALGASDVVWDERVDDVEVRVDGGLATAWMAYRFYAGETFSHCGVNAVQLVRAAAGWQIVQIIDTRRTACD